MRGSISHWWRRFRLQTEDDSVLIIGPPRSCRVTACMAPPPVDVFLDGPETLHIVGATDMRRNEGRGGDLA